MRTKLILTLALLATLAAAPRAATATTAALDVRVNEATKAWELYVQLSNDNRGLASFSVDVTGAGGAAVTSAVQRAPRTLDAGVGDFIGFTQFRNFPANGQELRASQDTIGADARYLILDLGTTAPLLLASGTYSGDVGTLTAALHPTHFVNVFPTGYAYGGATQAATSVSPDVSFVPEPSSAVAAAAAGGLFLTRRRRRNHVAGQPTD